MARGNRPPVVSPVSVSGHPLILVEDTVEADDAGTAPAFTRRWEGIDGLEVVTRVTTPGVDLETAIHEVALSAAFDAGLTAGLPKAELRETVRGIYEIASTPADVLVAGGSLPTGLAVVFDDLVVTGAQDATVTVVVRHPRGVQPVLELSALR